MSTDYFGHLKGFAIVTLLSTAVFSCTKSERTASKDALTGSWKVIDLTIVNQESGIHRTQKDLTGLGNSGIQFAADHSYLIDGSRKGNWNHKSDDLEVTSLAGETIQFKVTQTDDGAIRFERDLSAANGLSGAQVYYTLTKE